jgi:signal transduction histidine kinase
LWTSRLGIHRGFGGRRPAVVDAALTALSAAVVLLAMTAVQDNAGRPVAPYGYLLGVAIAAPNLLRRRAPRTVLLVSTVILMLYYALSFPGFSPFLALAVPLFTVGVSGHLRTGALVAAWVTVSGVISRADEVGSVMRTLPGSLTDTALVVGTLVLGDAVRARRYLRRELADGVRRAVREAERESERRAMAERLDIARDLHDVLAHSVAVIGVQANVAAELFEVDPPRAAAALDTIRTAGGEALADLGNTIRVLRVGARTAPVRGLGDLPALIDRALRSGVRVDLDVRGERYPLRPAIDLTAYRVIQESLTNVIRHAGASRARVEIAYAQAGVDIRVTDDGHGAVRVAPGPGQGLIGMGERVAALRGRLTAQDDPAGGFTVTAHLPVAL